jgi:hypothetical protein
VVVRNVLRLCAVVARTNWRGTGDETQLMFPGVLVFPFPLRERFIGNTVMSIDVFGAINPQAGKLCHCRQRRDNGTMLLVGCCISCGPFEPGSRLAYGLKS